MPENILEKLKKSPTTKVEVHESDPDVVAGVKEFLATHQVNLQEEEKQKERVQVPADQTVGAPGPDAEFMNEALVPVDNIEITEEEKRIYLKSLLSDELTRFPISLYEGKIVYSLRTRSMFEQRRILDVINDRIMGDTPKDPSLSKNMPGQFDMLQRYSALVMVERINGVMFSDLTLTPGPSLDEHYEILEAASVKRLSKMNTVCWTSILNAMRRFESKCVKLAENAVNEDFWKPRS
jgi:hypothetical protein